MFFVFFVTFYGDPNPDSYRMKGGEWLEAERSQPSGLLEDPGPYYSQPVLDTLLHILGGTAVCCGEPRFFGGAGAKFSNFGSSSTDPEPK